MAATMEAATMEVELDRRHATLRRSLGGDIPVRITVPLSSYRGIAARLFMPTGATTTCACLQLLHDDPALTLPVFVARDGDDLIAEWRCWGDRLSLPLLIVDEDGAVIEIAARLGAVRVSPPLARRHHSHFIDRRPRFLARRKPGRAAAGERVAGHEIIARA